MSAVFVLRRELLPELPERGGHKKHKEDHKRHIKELFSHGILYVPFVILFVLFVAKREVVLKMRLVNSVK